MTRRTGRGRRPAIRIPCLGSLTGRIIAAMSVMTAAVAAVYCLAVSHGIALAEETLIGGRLAHELDVRTGGGPQNRLPGSTIYADNAPGSGPWPALPDAYRGLPDGFSEVVGPEDRFVYKRTVPGKAGAAPSVWVIEQDQFGFEDLEWELYLGALAGLLLATGASALLGLGLARSVTRPVKRLSAALHDMARTGRFRVPDQALDDDEIGDLARALERTLAQLNTALVREKAFTADVGHELRTPLMVASSGLELLALQHPGLQARCSFVRIGHALERMRRLTQVFLELARGGGPGQADPASVAATAAEVVAAHAAQARAKGLVLEFSDRSSRPVQAGAVLVYCLIDNLVRNAVQYTASGRVVVTLGDSALEVADTGPGIGPQAQDLFEAFVRGENAPGEGYGWGLSLVRRICLHEGWTLAWRANDPRGTVFRIEGFGPGGWEGCRYGKTRMPGPDMASGPCP